MRAAIDDHYEVLGISRTTEQSQVKPAFLRLIAQHPPENDPQRFRLISDAYHVLGNPKRRREYDAEERLPTSIEAEFAELVKRAEQDPRDALPGLRALVAREPRSKRIRFQLGIALSRLEMHKAAVVEFQALFDLEPSNSNYAVWLGDGLCDAGERLKGRAFLKQAVVLDKNNTGAYLCLARQLAADSQVDEALAILDRGIHADGDVDAKDLPLFLEKLLILGNASRLSELDACARDLAGMARTEDKEAHEYITSRLGGLCDLANKAERFDLLEVLLAHLAVLRPEDTSLLEARRQAGKRHRRDLEVGHMIADDACAHWIKLLFGLVNGLVEASKRDDILRGLLHSTATRRSEMRREWDRFQTRYPEVHEELQEHVDRLWSALPDRSRAPSSSGCLLLLALLAAASTIAACAP